ncbi:hypothetical protein ADUPG1_009393 [Aduncisulcus paluster]|uniref:Uncharacterized protein n=1 Tax=Aduncisulcus paluster TaxID=2918883 RepID=A0ABQ5KVG6_9EUKA|nr:hypothetical protein ADUPG1_009393 [Aduncisulcus paluster]
MKLCKALPIQQCSVPSPIFRNFQSFCNSRVIVRHWQLRDLIRCVTRPKKTTAIWDHGTDVPVQLWSAKTHTSTDDPAPSSIHADTTLLHDAECPSTPSVCDITYVSERTLCVIPSSGGDIYTCKSFDFNPVCFDIRHGYIAAGGLDGHICVCPFKYVEKTIEEGEKGEEEEREPEKSTSEEFEEEDFPRGSVARILHGSTILSMRHESRIPYTSKKVPYIHLTASPPLLNDVWCSDTINSVVVQNHSSYNHPRLYACSNAGLIAAIDLSNTPDHIQTSRTSFPSHVGVRVDEYTSEEEDESVTLSSPPKSDGVTQEDIDGTTHDDRPLVTSSTSVEHHTHGLIEESTSGYTQGNCSIFNPGYGAVNGIAFSPDGRYAISYHDSSHICMMKVGAGDDVELKKVMDISLTYPVSLSAAFSMDSRLVCAATQHGDLCVFDIRASSKPFCILKSQSPGTREGAFRVVKTLPIIGTRTFIASQHVNNVCLFDLSKMPCVEEHVINIQALAEKGPDSQYACISGLDISTDGRELFVATSSSIYKVDLMLSKFLAGQETSYL